MKRLILVRHAKTEPRSASGEDFDRALTGQGRRDAAALGHALAAAGLIPDVALVSTAVRARETFQAMAAELPDVRPESRAELYDAPSEVLKAAADAAQGDTVLLVAHNPGVHALASMLVQACVAVSVDDRAALEAGFATATAAAFEFAHERMACLGVFRPGQGPA